MVRKASFLPSGSRPVAEWNPVNKEPWHDDLDREPVNDDKWTCVVTAAVPAKVDNEEHLKVFKRCCSTGVRPAIKIIGLDDIVRMLREKLGDGKGKGSEKREKTEKGGKRGGSRAGPEGVRPPPPRPSPIADFASRFASVADGELRLPPDLMASLIKYLILNLKDESVFWKRYNAVKQRKMREMKIKQDLIRSLKPYTRGCGGGIKSKLNLDGDKSNTMSDEPYLGPDLYIVLTDFHNPSYFTELKKINVPFLAVLKVTDVKETVPEQRPSNATEKPDKTEVILADFWQNLTDNSNGSEECCAFTDVLLLEYQPTKSPQDDGTDKEISEGDIFDQMSRVLYSVHDVYREHKMYLRELTVQRLVEQYQTLDLVRCTLYNKLCDALVTGDRNTVFLVLYAVIEQVVAGVPQMDGTVIEYVEKPDDCFDTGGTAAGMATDHQGPHPATMVTPCLRCRNRVSLKAMCRCLRDAQSTLDKEVRIGQTSSDREFHGDVASKGTQSHVPSSSSCSGDNDDDDDEEEEEDDSGRHFAEGLVDQSIREKLTTKRAPRSPTLCLYGDNLFLHNYHCDSRLWKHECAFDRFLGRTTATYLWSKFPEMPPEKRAFFNYHFSVLQQTASLDRNVLRTQVFFSLSMKLIGITKYYLYKGDEDDSPESLQDDKPVKVRYTENITRTKAKDETFYPFAFRQVSLIVRPKKEVPENNPEISKHDIQGVPTLSAFNLVVVNRKVANKFPHLIKTLNSSGSSNFGIDDPELAVLNTILECSEILNFLESQVFQDEGFIQFMNDYNYHEILEPERMVQRLLDVFDDFNTHQSFYFPPTDSLILILYNDSDHRGLLTTVSYGALLTPVSLRDFFCYTYLGIEEWLSKKRKDYADFVDTVKERDLNKQQEEDQRYLKKLKKQFKGMSQEEKEAFLRNDGQKVHKIDVQEHELQPLPIKPKPSPPTEKSFIATNYSNIRVEAQTKTKEYYSKDGTIVKVVTDTWLYGNNPMLTLSIKQANFRLTYHHWNGERRVKYNGSPWNVSFSLETVSGIIFHFYKGDQCDSKSEEEEEEELECDRKYRATITWPTGLIIQEVYLPEQMYIRQSYISTYRVGSDIGSEQCRCFLRNGQVLVFRENGHVDVFCMNGTKHVLKGFSSTTGETALTIYESDTITPTGEVWQRGGQNPYRYRATLVDTLKTHVGVDPGTHETYQRRDDGVSEMFWPDGKLVVVHPDGTKMTSIAEFDRKLVRVEWTEEEKEYYDQLEIKFREEREQARPRGKTILKKFDADALSYVTQASYPEEDGEDKGEDDGDDGEGFVSISVSYLMEHPKYASVFFSSKTSDVKIKMPEGVSITINPEGTYLVNQNRNYLSVTLNSVELFKTCSSCSERSHTTFTLDSPNVLCRFKDFFDKHVLVYRDGEMGYQSSGDGYTSEMTFNAAGDTNQPLNNCNHLDEVFKSQKCFAFERDFSGIEFLHWRYLAHECSKLPEETHYELSTKENGSPFLTHTFCSPYYKIGYETWTMDYEERDSLPTNMKKSDLRESGTRQSGRNRFKYQFPGEVPRQGLLVPPADLPRIPKVIVARTIKCTSESPASIISELQGYIDDYQKQAHALYREYRVLKLSDEVLECQPIKMRLCEIGLALTRSQTDPYPHMSTLVPSTEKDVHYFGHYLDFMNGARGSGRETGKNLPNCKQIPVPLQLSEALPSIIEEETEM